MVRLADSRSANRRQVQADRQVRSHLLDCAGSAVGTVQPVGSLSQHGRGVSHALSTDIGKGGIGRQGVVGRMQSRPMVLALLENVSNLSLAKDVVVLLAGKSLAGTMAQPSPSLLLLQMENMFSSVKGE